MEAYHFVGIKGTGMSALAQVLHDVGKNVQGSDVEKYFFTEEALKKKNIPIFSFKEENINEKQTIIVGNAFSDEHIEVQEATKRGLKIYRYHEFLADWIKSYTSIAVSGTHGKTSTTGLLAHVLSQSIPTSYLIGDGTGKGNKNSEYFAFESCEYRRHFLKYEPDYAIITNIDFDHPDYFKDLDDVFAAFQDMVSRVQKGVIACGDDEKLQQIHAKVPVVYYGLSSTNDFQAQNIRETSEGTEFDVFVRNTFYDTFSIPMYGNHHVLNALAVIAFCHYEGIPKDVLKHLKSFPGVKRRFTEKVVADQVMIDDYAHHPTEIRVTIESARKKYPEREIVAIFQPHTFTRTETFLLEFAQSLKDADRVYLCDIFGSTREENGQLSIEDLASLIPNSQLLKLENISQLKDHRNSVLLFMGAGDIQKFQKAYLGEK